MSQAALGAEITIETINGPESLRIPAGTQPSQVFRLRGKGVQYIDGAGRGDHFVHAVVRVPTSLTDEQRQLLEQLASVSGEEVTGSRRVLDKVKDFFSN